MGDGQSGNRISLNIEKIEAIEQGIVIIKLTLGMMSGRIEGSEIHPLSNDQFASRRSR
jgi:hypothetical protein